MDAPRLSPRNFARRWLAWASLVVLGACAPRPVAPPPAPAPVYDAVVHARVLSSTDARRIDDALLDSAITAPHPRVRAAAALAIGQLRARRLLPQVREALRDPDSTVARSAAFALGLLRDSTHTSPLRVAADSAPLYVGAEALWSLGEIGEVARPQIEALLADTSFRLPRWRRELLLAATKLRPLPATLIVPFLTHPDTEVVWAAAYAISRTRAPEGLRALTPLAESPSAEVRAQVARALTRAATGDSLASIARETLIKLAADSHPHVRINTARSAATHGMSEIIAKLASDSNANVRITAAQSAVAPASGSLPRIYFERMFSDDTSWMFRKSVIESAFRAGIRLAAAGQWISSPDWRRRATVAEAMAGSRSASTLEELDQLTRDADARVRAATFRALSSFADSGDAAPRVRTMLLVALRDSDAVARAAAIGALTRSAMAAEVPFVLASHRAAESDRDNDARLAAIRFFGSAWRRDSAAFTRSMQEGIRSLAAPSDPLERRAAMGIPLLAHWTPSRVTTPPRQTEWYESLLARYAEADSQLVAEIETERGTIVVELLTDEAPLTVDNFVTLARRGYYDNLRYHRVVPNFVIQDGDPRGDGNGGPGYMIRDELNPIRYERGVVGMALSGPDTGGSQYFITHSPQPHLDGHYAAFGRVLSGLEVLDSIIQGDTIRRVRIR
jgi:cyclophilin family peptidyl-prolyl cis-trans isomerase/HEAT repeat protein